MSLTSPLRLEKRLPVGSYGGRPTRVLHVINNLDVGGAEKRLLDVTRHVDSSRFELHYCTFSGRLGALSSDFEAAGARLHSTRMGIRFAYQFKKILQKIQTLVFPRGVRRVLQPAATPICNKQAKGQGNHESGFELVSHSHGFSGAEVGTG